jgi:hypothetical protein
VKETELEDFSCSILDAFDLPTDIVYSYNQPWDPIVRLFSQYDPLYPLIDDLGEFLLRVQWMRYPSFSSGVLVNDYSIF